MDNKLQQLTEKLYNDGLSKGKAEADALLNEAKQEAEKIISDAQAEASKIKEQAAKSADDAKRNANAEIELASRQTIARVKQTVENLVVTKTIDDSTSKAFDDVNFVKDLIKTAVEKISANTDQTPDLSVILPAAKEEEFMTLVKKGMTEAFGQGIDVKFDRSIKSGFRIAEAKGGYQITFTDADFASLFKAHIRSKLVELLFGKV